MSQKSGIDDKDKIVTKINEEIANLESLQREYIDNHKWDKLPEVNWTLTERSLVLDVIEKNSLEPISSKIDEMEKRIYERRKDHYYADSFEQSAQITKDIKDLEAQKDSLVELTKAEEIKRIQEKNEDKHVILEDSMGIDSKEDKDKMVNKVNEEIANLKSLKKEYIEKYEWNELQSKLIEVNWSLIERSLVLDVIEKGSIEPILSKIAKMEEDLSKRKEEYQRDSKDYKIAPWKVELIEGLNVNINKLVELTQTEEIKRIQEKAVQKQDDNFKEDKNVIPADLLWIDSKNGKVMEENARRAFCLKEAAFVEDPKNNQVILKGKSYGKEIQTVLSSEEFALGKQFQFSHETVLEVAKRKNEMYHEQQLIQKERT